MPIHPSTLRRWRKQGLIPFRRINARHFLYSKKAILQTFGLVESAHDVIRLHDLMRTKTAAEVLADMRRAGTSPRQILDRVEQRHGRRTVAEELRSITWPLDRLRV